MNQVVSFHHHSPAKKPKHLSGMESMPPGREGEGLQQWPGLAVLEYEASEPPSCALVPPPCEQGYPVGCFQCPNVRIRDVSLLTRALTKLKSKACCTEEGVIQEPVRVVGSPIACRDHRFTQAVVSISAPTGDPGQTMAEKIQKSVKIAPGAVVCVESEIKGDVTIGPRTVVHPKARIIAEAGPIVIGEGNLIEEQALIINAHPDNITPDAEDPEPKTMIIGTNNVFEVGCYSQAMKMGDNNVIESKAYVGRNVILTSGCIIGACCNLNTFEVIPENTVIYGVDCLRRVQTERPQPQTLQLDFLMKILPNYHHLKKTMKGSSTPVKN
ncbi:Dynactin subunit 6 [Pteropus alecto]|uniref:Dynactin subunit 6 n=4 Tax=Chiroptera TaxID=9397 RepID=L5KAR6_PTEAL|nr:Dynactin subunit 6 [Pteropus alecto]